MNPIAIYYENSIIYWSSIIIVAGIISGFTLSLSLYASKNKYSYPFFLFFPPALILSVYLSRILHWYCNNEQYESFDQAVSNLQSGSFLIPGVIAGVWISAFVLYLLFLIKSRYQILDPLGPGLAFIIGIIRLSSIFTESCRGKATITNPLFQRLPFAIATGEGPDGAEYRLASFFISFLLMMAVTLLLIIFYIKDEHIRKKEPLKPFGHTFRAFLVLYGAVEIVMDSTRYDASHLYFPGEALASLNKGAGFMGLSQLLGALCCIYVFIYYLVMSIKANGRSKKHILPPCLFVAGFIMAAVAEYLVQRFTSTALYCYILQTTGVILLVVSIYILYASCLHRKSHHHAPAETTDK